LLQQYPMPEPGYRRPRVQIQLTADAEATAADLHTRYGPFLSLQVRALRYPPRNESAPAPPDAGT
jgi:hypothetical protein